MDVYMQCPSLGNKLPFLRTHVEYRDCENSVNWLCGGLNGLNGKCGDRFRKIRARAMESILVRLQTRQVGRRFINEFINEAMLHKSGGILGWL